MKIESEPQINTIRLFPRMVHTLQFLPLQIIPPACPTRPYVIKASIILWRQLHFRYHLPSSLPINTWVFNWWWIPSVPNQLHRCFVGQLPRSLAAAKTGRSGAALASCCWPECPRWQPRPETPRWRPATTTGQVAPAPGWTKPHSFHSRPSKLETTRHLLLTGALAMLDQDSASQKKKINKRCEY